jgi:hypothetical protein
MRLPELYLSSTLSSHELGIVVMVSDLSIQWFR